MDRVSKLGYLALGVTNLNEAIDYYSKIVRLDVTDRDAGVAFMTGGTEHHWLRLEEGNGQGVKRIGFEVPDETTLEVIRADLKAMNVDFVEGGDLKSDRLARWLRFEDPAGSSVELYTSMLSLPTAPPNSGVAMEKFLHGGWAIPNYDETLAFYQRVLGFKPSDFIGDMATFLRCGDRYHHSLVLVRSRAKVPQLDHFCIQVESIDDVMRFRHNAVRNNVAIRDDLLRHAPSGSIGVYVKDEARGFAIEYCTGHPQVDDSSHQARVLPATPETFDIWQSKLPEPSLTAIQSARLGDARIGGHDESSAGLG